MSIRFDSQLLVKDLEAYRKRKKLSLYKVAVRTDIAQTTLYRLRDGSISDITVTTLARILDFMNLTDIDKYIQRNGE